MPEDIPEESGSDIMGRPRKLREDDGRLSKNRKPKALGYYPKQLKENLKGGYQIIPVQDEDYEYIYQKPVGFRKKKKPVVGVKKGKRPSKSTKRRKK